jgi:hypothetical protein
MHHHSNCHFFFSYPVASDALYYQPVAHMPLCQCCNPELTLAAASVPPQGEDQEDLAILKLNEPTQGQRGPH